VLVTDVPEGPARDADMQAGDVIMSFDGAEVANTRELVRRVGDTEVGKDARVVVMRDGRSRTLVVTLGRRETAEGAAPSEGAETPQAPVERTILGLTLRAMTADEREMRALPPGTEGVLVTEVDETSEAFAKGMRADDVISEAGQQRVSVPADLEARIAEAREAGRRSILLLIRRGGDPRFVALGIE